MFTHELVEYERALYDSEITVLWKEELKLKRKRLAIIVYRIDHGYREPYRIALAYGKRIVFSHILSPRNS